MGYLFPQFSLLFPTLFFFTCKLDCSQLGFLPLPFPAPSRLRAWMQDNKCKHKDEDFEKERQKIRDHTFIFFSSITEVQHFHFKYNFGLKVAISNLPSAQGELSVLFSVKSWHSLTSPLCWAVTCTENESHTFPSTNTAARHWMLGDNRVGVGKKQQTV